MPKTKIKKHEVKNKVLKKALKKVGYKKLVEEPKEELTPTLIVEVKEESVVETPTLTVEVKKPVVEALKEKLTTIGTKKYRKVTVNHLNGDVTTHWEEVS